MEHGQAMNLDPQIIGIPIIFTPSIVMEGHFGPFHTLNWRMIIFSPIVEKLGYCKGKLFGMPAKGIKFELSTTLDF